MGQLLFLRPLGIESGRLKRKQKKIFLAPSSAKYKQKKNWTRPTDHMRVLHPSQYPVSLSDQCWEPASCPPQSTEKAAQLDRCTQLHSLSHGRFLHGAVFPLSRLTGLSVAPAPVDRLPLSTLELGNGFRSCNNTYIHIYPFNFYLFIAAAPPSCTNVHWKKPGWIR